MPLGSLSHCVLVLFDFLPSLVPYFPSYIIISPPHFSSPIVIPFISPYDDRVVIVNLIY